MSPNAGRPRLTMSSTLLPFLYQTRTLQHAIRRPLLTRALHAPRAPRPYQRRGRPRDNNHDDDDLVPFDFGPDQGNLAATRRRRTPGSTITETEKRVFDEIFGAISQRRKQLGGAAILPGVEPAPSEGLPTKPEDEGKDEQQLRRERILSMYPPALRQAAETALGLQAEEDRKPDAPVVSEGAHDIASPEESESDSEILKELEASRAAERDALLSLHKAERARFQALLQSCTSDVAVWDVLEGEVFSMVERLGIADKKPPPKRKAMTQAPAPRLSMERYGPLFSVYLLAALRHLDRAFASPSPLALNVLPRIQELGMAPYVLGVSTRFYNELLSIYWHRYGDPDAVVRLLRDMERSGLSPDRQTLKIVETVMAAIEGLGAAGGNPFAEVLGSMKEFDTVAFEKLQNHKRRVLVSLEQQVAGLPF